ncbi:hypothetical protein HRQ91_04055 [Treponema parvum]|uniref:Uncharacterized protein n=1 Tax=Treponema parvum TaxID=138851 RepID=A0A975F3J4_9SPIR|nr:hypothetical protein [Treponema parvum]QTQ13697.1 hypothetical protein HRQ91_04055 [Treponema parvum]
MSGQRNKRTIATKYFEIIYASGSEKTASLVASNIDAIYESICAEFYETPWMRRFPVTITNSVDDLNAYYTPYPYNRIVLYDTLPNEEFSVFSNTVLSVLYHELVHAVTFNMKNKVFKILGKIFGDALNPAFVNVPPSVSEGAAVLMESLTDNSLAAGNISDGDGEAAEKLSAGGVDKKRGVKAEGTEGRTAKNERAEGRVNSFFSTHVVRQAKIDNKFPTWREITGARDVFPVGEMPYIFGGMFYTYVRQTFGDKKYAEFWRRLVNSFDLKFYEGMFKKVFGAPLDQVWRDWYESIEIPADLTVTDREPAGSVSGPDASGGGGGFTLYGDRASESQLFTSLTSSVLSVGRRIAWIDSATDSVWIKYFNEEGEPEKLFTLPGISRIKFSSDGRYLAVSRTNPRDGRNYSGIYDVKTKKLKFARQPGLRDAAVVCGADGAKYLSAVCIKSQRAQIRLYKIKESSVKADILSDVFMHIDFNRKAQAPHTTSGRTPQRSQGTEDVLSDRADNTLMPFSLTDGGNGMLSWIVKDGMKNKIVLCEINSKNIRTYVLPKELDGVNIKFLSGIVPDGFLAGQTGVLLTFSYTVENSLPRLGYFALDLDKENTTTKKRNAFWYLQKRDVSGGVYYPAAKPLSQGVQFPDSLYIARFFDSKKIRFFSGDDMEFERFSAEEEKPSILPAQRTSAKDSKNFTPEKAAEAAEIERFGIQGSKPYFPLKYFADGLFLPVSGLSFYDAALNETTGAPLGLLWITSDPWMGTLLSFTGGYDVAESLGGIGVTVSGGTYTDAFKYEFTSSVIFDDTELFQTAGKLTLTSSIQAGALFDVVFYDAASAMKGHSFDADSGKNNSFDWLSVNNLSEIMFSTVRKTGRSYYSSGGFFAGPALKNEYYDCANLDFNSYYANLGFKIGYKLPYILPFLNLRSDGGGATLNIPHSASVSFLPSAGTFASLSADLVLFSYEVQRGFSMLMPFYMKRFSFVGSYNGKYKYLDYGSWDIKRAAELLQNCFEGDMDYYDRAGLAMDLYFAFNSGSFTQVPIRMRFLGEYAIRKKAGENRFNFGIRTKILM